MDELLAARAAVVAEVREACAHLARAPEAQAAEIVERGARALLAELRSPASEPSLASRPLVWMDERVRSERAELLDRSWVPRKVKERAVQRLDEANGRFGMYRQWTAAIAGAVSGRAEAHVHDLAGGVGGFAIHLAGQPIPSCRLRVTSSDVDAGYIAIGVARARKVGADVRFEQRDALDLRDVSGVDLFTCMQALHHFSPGQVVRMLAQAVPRASLGFLMIDLSRSASNAVASFVLGSIVAPYLPLIHDGVLSVRRSYMPSELTLLGRLAGATSIEAGPFGPGHILLHARA